MDSITTENQIENLIDDVLKGRNLNLYRMMSYQMGWEKDENGYSHINPPKRLFASLCLDANKAFGGKKTIAYTAAVSMELLYNYYLIHKDLQEGTLQRNKRDTAWWVWGPAQAINIGDGMHSLARKALFHLHDQGIDPKHVFEALRIFENTGLKMCEGQFQDIDYQETVIISPESYLNMIENRTASLFSCSFSLGALTASASSDQIEAIGLFGRNLGMSYQIQEDCNSIWGTETQKTLLEYKILNKKKILPVVLAFAKGSISVKRKLGEIYFKRMLEKNDLLMLSEVLDELEIQEECKNISANYFQKSLLILAKIGLPKKKIDVLKNVADSFADSNQTILN